MNILNANQLLAAFGPDRRWYEEHIPLLDCPDPLIQEVYYYRWEMYKRHLRNLGSKGYIVTEFINDVSWQGSYGTINAAAGHHIYEGRWLRDRRYLDDYIDFWLRGDGEIRRYSFWAADAAYAFYKVQGGSQEQITRRLDALVDNFTAWQDHYDEQADLYWVNPCMDATEYTIAGLDVGDGWGGDAFRPTINSYMAADARAIARLAEAAGHPQIAEHYQQAYQTIRANLLERLWNERFLHFMDRFNARYPDQYGQFASGPELAGFVPWMFGLPEQHHAVQWASIKDSEKFRGEYGLRTIWPSHPEYMVQHRTPGEMPGECEWNGPSWPFQTSQVLMGLGRLLTNYEQSFMTRQDYYALLREYAAQHTKNGRPHLAENLDPDTGVWIADYPDRSEHYNHSTFNDLVISGLLGLKPQEDDTLVISPLIPEDWSYFCLENVPYRGHNLTVLYDRDGTHYKRGISGLNVFVDGIAVLKHADIGFHRIAIPVVSRESEGKTSNLINYAFQDGHSNYPSIKASHTAEGSSLMDVLDGRIWYDNSPRHGWSSSGSGNPSDWIEIDFGQIRSISEVVLHFIADAEGHDRPQQCKLLFWSDAALEWEAVIPQKRMPAEWTAGTANRIQTVPVKTSRIRVEMEHLGSGIVTGLAEIEVFGHSAKSE